MSSTSPVPPIFLVFSLALLATTAAADSVTEQLRDCASIKTNDERLTCYDTLSQSLDQRAKQNFGREQKRIAEEAPDAISATVTEIREAAYGKLVITLDNGQVWRQKDSKRIHLNSGDAIIVERALFGSFMLKSADGGRSIRVTRVR